jgi:uncharacterized membrane protein YphA (DoxX/SURF4 family)
METYTHNFAELIMRCFAGILFFFQGYDKLFRIGLKEVVKTFHPEAVSHEVPDAFVWMMTVFTSVIEFSCGILLVLGLFKTWVLMLLGIDLILVCFAFSFMHAIWDLKHVFPRLAIIITLLLVPQAWGAWSLDQLILK